MRSYDNIGWKPVYSFLCHYVGKYVVNPLNKAFSGNGNSNCEMLDGAPARKMADSLIAKVGWLLVNALQRVVRRNPDVILLGTRWFRNSSL
jgi:hypothetical protein